MRRVLVTTFLATAWTLGAAPPGSASFVVLKLDRGIKTSARLPAAAGDGGVVLPVLSGALGTRATTLQHAGSIVVGGVRMSRVRSELGRSDRITAVVGGQRRVVMTLRGSARVTKRTRRVAISARIVPAGPLRARVGAGSIGRMSADVTLAAPLASFKRPASAGDVTSSSMTWHVRESFVRYLAAGEGVQARGGATGLPPRTAAGSDAPLVYDFAFTPASGGWHDASSGRTLLRFSGALRFRYKAHGIDLRVSDPELRLTASRAITVFTIKGADGTGVGTRRDELVRLDISGLVVNGASRAQDRAPGTVTPAGSDLLAGFYSAGDEFGAVSFGFDAP